MSEQTRDRRRHNPERAETPHPGQHATGIRVSGVGHIRRPPTRDLPEQMTAARDLLSKTSKSGAPKGAQDTTRRGPATSTVRSLRQQLTSDIGIRPEFDHELLSTYCKNQLSIVPLAFLLAVAVAGSAATFVPPTNAISWLFAAFLANCVLILTCKRFEKVPQDKFKARIWRLRFISVEFFTGALWGSVMLLPIQTYNELVMVFPLAAGLVLLAMRTVVASYLPLAVLAGTVPVTIAILLRYWQMGGEMAPVMALIALGAQLLFGLIAYRLYRGVVGMLALRSEKDAIFAELEREKSISDESRRRAEQSNLAKSRFLATMSHELRTPLNAILGFSEVLKDEILGKHEVESYKDYGEDIHKSGHHLLNLINEILDLSRIEAGRHELSEEAVSLIDTASDCRHLLTLRAKEKRMTINEQFEDDLPRIWADERSVRQVILNLLSNAIKFTPPGGTIDITVGWTAGGGQYVSVRDNGPGIPEDEIPTVLEAFGRSSAAHNSAEEGSGLGLPIVMGLVERHGGRFSINSRLREGTEVIATFPRERVMKTLSKIAQPRPEPKLGETNDPMYRKAG
jgi:two-component system cell cycle sensor histidine kinase PleC